MKEQKTAEEDINTYVVNSSKYRSLQSIKCGERFLGIGILWIRSVFAK